MLNQIDSCDIFHYILDKAKAIHSGLLTTLSRDLNHSHTNFARRIQLAQIFSRPLEKPLNFLHVVLTQMGGPWSGNNRKPALIKCRVRVNRLFIVPTTLIALTGLMCTPSLADSHGQFPGKGSRATWEKAAALADQAIDMTGPKKVDAGIPLLKKAIEIYPYDAKIYYVLGNRYADKGQSELAKVNYTKAVELEPNFADAWYNLGTIQDDLHDSKGAAKSYSQSIKAKNNNAKAWYNLGVNQYLQGRYSESRQSFESMLKVAHTSKNAEDASYYLKKMSSTVEANSKNSLKGGH